MAVRVSFFIPARFGAVRTEIPAAVRKSEDIELNASTTATLSTGELALVVNMEATAVLVAWGTTPNASATTSTADTTAGVAVPAGASVIVAPIAGDKINAQALPE